MNRLLLAAALSALCTSVNSAIAYPGPAPFGTAIADYDLTTGQMSVSVNNVRHWFIHSASESLFLDHPDVLPVAGGLVTDNDAAVGETHFELFTYTNINLGNITIPDLPAGDLTINWSYEGLGFPLAVAPVSYVFAPLVPEPTTLTLAAISLIATANRSRSRRRQ